MIQKLTLENFRAHEHTALELEKLNWIVGAEEAGKSTIPLGLEFAMQRKNEYITDDRGKGVDWLKKTGTKKAVVSCVMSSGEYHQNSIPSDSKNDSSADYPEDLIKICLRCRHILHMPEKEQKEFFQGLLLGPVGSETILQQLNTYDDQLPGLGDKFREMFQDVEKMDIDTMLSYATAERKSINALHDAAKVWKTPEKPQVTRSVKAEDLQKARKQLEEAQKKVTVEEELIKNLKHLAARDLNDWKTLQFRRSQLQKELENAEKEVDRIKLSITPDLAEPIGKLEKEITSVSSDIEVKQKEISRFVGEGPCPKGTCARVELGPLQRNLQALQAQKDLAQKQLSKLVKDNNDNKLRQQSFSVAEARWLNTKKQVDECAPLGEQPEEKAVDDEKLQGLKNQERLFGVAAQQAERDYNACQKIAEIEKQIADNATELQGLIELKKIWDVIVKALGPHGIKTKLLETSLGVFQAEVNKKLHFFGVKLHFNLESWGLLVDTGKGYGFIPVQFLSPSAETKVSIGLQLVIAQRKNFPCITIDEHRFGPMLRSRLFAFLLKEDVQSIVISTLMELDADRKLIVPKHPGAPGVSLFYVQAGTVTEITNGVKPELSKALDAELTPAQAESMNQYIASGGKLD